MNILSKAIKIDNNIKIYADWNEYEEEYGFDVIEITIFENCF